MSKYTDDILLRFASNVKRLRNEKGMSQEELAFQAQVHRTYIGMVERAERNVSLIYAEKIAKALGVGIDELVK